MRHILIATVLVGSVLASSAMAADVTDKGAIKSMDAKKCTITLADSKVFQFADKCDFAKLKAGENVTITYTVKGTVNNASKVAAA